MTFVTGKQPHAWQAVPAHMVTLDLYLALSACNCCRREARSSGLRRLGMGRDLLILPPDRFQEVAQLA
ncbi:MAG: hypothetical protein ABR915_06370, partial [Thermoguttaceae bacterium]